MINTKYIHTCSECGYSWTTDEPIQTLTMSISGKITVIPCKGCGMKGVSYDEMICKK